MPTIDLTVSFTQDQYNRFKAGLGKMQGQETPATDEQLIAQMKREASAITYAAEAGKEVLPNWSY